MPARQTLQALYALYPQVLSRFSSDFDNREFCRALAQADQAAFLQALYDQPGPHPLQQLQRNLIRTLQLPAYQRWVQRNPTSSQAFPEHSGKDWHRLP
ncbi:MULTISPECIES: hypothetical protein [Leeia]|uniref:Uncharacterized protein n=1 Tax=Leeia aquatica TaxID=2725557 RepID=A0A847SEH1_9NEIS|nr:hypothetical protein [Leeia aquatica]NLR75588.1 hypothetical protein [Leeia aquatica]